MAVQFCSVTASFNLVLLLIASVFLLFVYKVQLNILISLPSSGGQEACFLSLLCLAFFFRLLHVIYLVWNQVTANIFLVDWERPRNPSANQAAGGVVNPVSIWRTYFLANEWNELQSLRKISPTLVLATLLVFLEVVGLGNLAERGPSSHVTTPDDRYAPPHSNVLRYGVSVILYVIFASVTVCA